MKTAELTGALLNYWVARAEGIPADALEIRMVPRTDNQIVVHTVTSAYAPQARIQVVLNYTDNWQQCGPLIEKHMVSVGFGLDCWSAESAPPYEQEGNTPQEAICRSIVRGEFGDDVEDSPCL